MTFYLAPDIQVYCTHDEREDVPYGSWEKSHSHSVGSTAIIRATARYGGVPVDFEPKVGKTVYLVYMIWSSGDSFGRDDQGSSEQLIYRTREDAEKARAVLLEPLPKVETQQSWDEHVASHTVKVPLPSGNGEQTFCRPWFGHFESLDSIDIHELTVVAK